MHPEPTPSTGLPYYENKKAWSNPGFLRILVAKHSANMTFDKFIVLRAGVPGGGLIPAGRVTSYGAIARYLGTGRSCRAWWAGP